MAGRHPALITIFNSPAGNVDHFQIIQLYPLRDVQVSVDIQINIQLHRQLEGSINVSLKISIPPGIAVQIAGAAHDIGANTKSCTK